MGGNHDRARESQDAFRRANNEIAAQARDIGGGDLAPFLCECADERCTQIVQLTLDEYEDVRSDDGRHLLLPGHALAPDERVREQSDRYWIAEKSGNGVRHTPASA